MQKLSNQSLDISQENIKKVEELFPNCVTETYDKDGNLVRSIDVNVIAERVENDEQLDNSRNLGFNLVQGFYFSGPLTPEDASLYVV